MVAVALAVMTAACAVAVSVAVVSAIEMRTTVTFVIVGASVAYSGDFDGKFCYAGSHWNSVVDCACRFSWVRVGVVFLTRKGESANHG